ncbi:MAG: hypothetical protein JWO38_3902 [Gemmataceae bacterium]|nr:hypothetical protein [Gemmataceae bacterium]
MNNACPSCGKVYRIGPDLVGKKLLCKQCGKHLVVASHGLAFFPLDAPPPPAPAPAHPAPPPGYSPPSAGYPPSAAVYTYPAPPPHPPFDLEEEPDGPVSRPSYRRSRDPFMNFLTFRLMITPVLIQILFWIGVAGCLFVGIKMMTSSFESPEPAFGGRRLFVADDEPDLRPSSSGRATKPADTGDRTHFSPVVFAGGILFVVVGPVVLRVYCETAIVFFKIHDEMKEMNDRSSRFRA